MSNDPVERFNQLPAATRLWLESRQTEDWKAIDDAMELFEKARTIAKFWKWLVITLVAIFLTTAALGDSIVKLASWVRGWLR